MPQLRDSIANARSALTDLLDKQPLVLGALGLAGIALRDPARARFSVKFTSAGDRYLWGAVPVTNLIIAVDTKADLEYAPTEHVLDYFPPG